MSVCLPFLSGMKIISFLHITVASSVACLAGSTIFLNLTHERHDFGKKCLKIKFVIFPTNLFKILLILRIIQLGIILNVHSSCYSCLILRRINFLDRYLKNPRLSNWIKMPLVGDMLFHADR
jgi:hypothetical protein